MQGTKAPLLTASRLHSNVLCSLEVNVKVAPVWFVGDGGPRLVIEVSGAVPSTLTEALPVNGGNGCPSTALISWGVQV
ncbi:MAG: hypothetical protein ACRDMK_09020 [Gaiellaceae bacterium]